MTQASMQLPFGTKLEYYSHYLPRFMDTHLLRTPPYYGQFSLSLGKVHTLSLSSTHLIHTPVNKDNRHLFLAQWTDSQTYS